MIHKPWCTVFKNLVFAWMIFTLFSCSVDQDQDNKLRDFTDEESLEVGLVPQENPSGNSNAQNGQNTGNQGSTAASTGLSIGANQVTIIADSSLKPGDRAVLNGIEYLIVDNQSLREIVVNQREDLSRLVTTYVTDMSELFKNKQTLTPNISSWDTSNVTHMKSMFEGATIYNGDVSFWNTGKVTDFSYMFAQTGGFNQDIGSWDTKASTNMEGMFYKAAVFNQDLSYWCVSLITQPPTLFSAESPIPQEFLPRWGTCPD
jgi:surface protein